MKGRLAESEAAEGPDQYFVRIAVAPAGGQSVPVLMEQDAGENPDNHCRSEDQSHLAGHAIPLEHVRIVPDLHGREDQEENVQPHIDPEEAIQIDAPAEET